MKITALSVDFKIKVFFPLFLLFDLTITELQSGVNKALIDAGKDCKETVPASN